MDANTQDGARLGPIWLNAGITRRNALTYLYAAFFTIGLVAVVSFMQPYLLSNNLGMATEEEGRASSILQVSYEIIVLLAVGPLGALADRIGRRPIYAMGFAWMGASFMLFPLVENLTQLVLCRMFFGVGSACVTSMMATVLADYPKERSRGVLLGASGICNGLGAITMVLLLSQLPGFFGDMGYDALESGRLTYWFGAALAILSAVVVARGLASGKPGKQHHRTNLLKLLGGGALAARQNPRLLVACMEAFVARGDLVVVNTFFALWARQAGVAGGLTLEEAVAKAGMFAAIISLANLCGAPFWGFVLDRFDRLSVLAGAMLTATIAYVWVGFSPDPLAFAFIPAALLLGIGEGGAILSGAAVIGQESPQDIRGSVVGLFNVCGSVGILTIAGVGGILFDAWMPGAPFVFVAGVNFAIFACALAVRLRTGRRSPQLVTG
ncbi:MAG: MFS transporter [Gammaproteobacteria bacterium]